MKINKQKRSQDIIEYYNFQLIAPQNKGLSFQLARIINRDMRMGLSTAVEISVILIEGAAARAEIKDSSKSAVQRLIVDLKSVKQKTEEEPASIAKDRKIAACKKGIVAARNTFKKMI